MKYFDWNEDKNELLKLERNISFEQVVIAIISGGLLKTLRHPNKRRYPNQKMYVVEIDKYAYLVPFVEDTKKKFLKTIIPSRKMTKKYLIKKNKK